jgi:hypothetical protein
LLALSNWRKDEMLSSGTFLIVSVESHVVTMNSFRVLTSNYRNLSREAQWNGFVLEGKWDGRHLVYTIEQMTPEEHAAFLAEELESEQRMPVAAVMWTETGLFSSFAWKARHFGEV